MLDGHDTLYLCAPAHDQRRLRPVFATLVSQVVEAAFRAPRGRRTARPAAARRPRRGGQRGADRRARRPGLDGGRTRRAARHRVAGLRPAAGPLRRARRDGRQQPPGEGVPLGHRRSGHAGARQPAHRRCRAHAAGHDGRRRRGHVDHGLALGAPPRSGGRPASPPPGTGGRGVGAPPPGARGAAPVVRGPPLRAPQRTVVFLGGWCRSATGRYGGGGDEHSAGDRTRVVRRAPRPAQGQDEPRPPTPRAAGAGAREHPTRGHRCGTRTPRRGWRTPPPCTHSCGATIPCTAIRSGSGCSPATPTVSPSCATSGRAATSATSTPRRSPRRAPSAPTRTRAWTS